MTDNELEALASETVAKCEACERREPGSCFVPFTPYDHILAALRRAAGAEWIPVGELVAATEQQAQRIATAERTATVLANGIERVSAILDEAGVLDAGSLETRVQRLVADKAELVAMLELVTAYTHLEERFGHMDEYQRIMQEQSNLITAARRLLGKEINEQR